MRIEALRYLACPACHAALRLLDGRSETDGHVMAGTLGCLECARPWPIRRGVPRLVHESQAESLVTASRFASEWRIFSEVEPHHRAQFLDWISPFGPDDVRARDVLEGGCGKGRHSRLLGEWAARAVVSIDLGDAVDVAFGNTRHLRNVHVAQMDLLRPALADSFDVAIGVGVLHHLADPEQGFRTLVASLRPGGRVITWTYGLENNEWIVRFVDPVRRAVTSRLPSSILLAASAPIALALWSIAKVARSTGLPIPYAEYVGYIGRLPLREIVHIVFDHLTPPIAYYIPRSAVESWYRSARLESITLAWHNHNSWRGSALKPAA